MTLVKLYETLAVSYSCLLLSFTMLFLQIYSVFKFLLHKSFYHLFMGMLVNMFMAVYILQVFLYTILDFIFKGTLLGMMAVVHFQMRRPRFREVQTHTIGKWCSWELEVPSVFRWRLLFINCVTHDNGLSICQTHSSNLQNGTNSRCQWQRIKYNIYLGYLFTAWNIINIESDRSDRVVIVVINSRSRGRRINVCEGITINIII